MNTEIKTTKISKQPLASSPLGAGGLVRVGIVGGAGYTGGELIRLLINHPNVEISFIDSKSNAGKHVHEVHHDLIGETDLKFGSFFNASSSDKIPSYDVLFLCVGHGDARKFLEANAIPDNVKIIDLSQDFRLKELSGYEVKASGNQKPTTRKFVYGLPELNKACIQTAQYIANPGCFASAIQLGLLPLAQAGLLNKDIYTTGITGSTGAGQGLSGTSHFSWRANNIQAYKTLSHQHLKEISESLNQLQGSHSASETGSLHFVPWRGDFTRGIFISSQIDCELSLIELKLLYKTYYKDHPFTIVSDDPIYLKQVVNTNKCVIQLEKVGSKLVVHSAVDNLLKGASGQAVQNMNLLFGLEETAGLRLKANYF